MHITHICFDLDDTLWPCAPAILNAEAAFYHWLSEFFPAITQRWSEADVIALRTRFMQANAHRRHNLTLLRKQWLRDVIFANMNVSEAIIEAAFDVFWQARNQPQLYPEVPSVLTRLSTQFHLSSLTNGNAHAEKAGLETWLKCNIRSETVGVSKPDPLIYHALLDALNITAGQCLMVGDDPINDVIGASAIGMPTAWVNRNSNLWPNELSNTPPNIMITSLNQLEAKMADLT